MNQILVRADTGKCQILPRENFRRFRMQATLVKFI